MFWEALLSPPEPPSRCVDWQKRTSGMYSNHPIPNFTTRTGLGFGATCNCRYRLANPLSIYVGVVVDWADYFGTLPEDSCLVVAELTYWGVARNKRIHYVGIMQGLLTFPSSLLITN